MSRELKFRYYDPSLKVMLSPDYIGEFGFYADGRAVEDGKSEPLDRLMQFTGLKDKNGREAYEGDIVRFLDGECTSTESGMDCDEVEGIGVIEWCDDRKGWDITNRLGVDTDEAFQEFEIIGDIYRNPDLLCE